MTKKVDPYTLIEAKMNIRLLNALLSIENKENKKEILIQIGREIEIIEHNYRTTKPLYPDLKDNNLERKIAEFFDDYCDYLATEWVENIILDQYTTITKIDDYLARVKQEVKHLENKVGEYKYGNDPIQLGFDEEIVIKYKEDLQFWLELWFPFLDKTKAKRMGELIGKEQEEKNKLIGKWHNERAEFKRKFGIK